MQSAKCLKPAFTKIMFNPWIWLGAVIFAALIAAGSYSAGSRHATNAAKAAYAEQLVKEKAEAHAQGVEDMQLEAEQQNQRTITKVEYRDRIVKVQGEINANPSNCILRPAVRLSINDAIKSANSKISADSGKLPTTKPVGQ